MLRMLVLRKAQPPISRPSPASCPASSSHAYPQTLESRAVCYSQKRLIHTSEHFRNRLVQSHLCRHKLCRLWVRSVCPYSCTSFPPSSHASQPGRPTSCLNMQAPSRQSLNIRVSMGASATQPLFRVKIGYLLVKWEKGNRLCFASFSPLLCLFSTASTLLVPELVENTFGRLTTQPTRRRFSPLASS